MSEREAKERGEEPGEGGRMPDLLPMRRIVVVAGAAVVVFGLAALWSASVQRGETGSLRNDTAPKPAKAGEGEVGIVFQRRFDDRLGASKDEQGRRRLEGAGWVDRERGVVHVPIEQAMEILARRRRP